MKSPIILCLVVLFLAGCSQPISAYQVESGGQVLLAPTSDDALLSEISSQPDVVYDPSQCKLEPIIVPKLPDKIPGYVQLDKTTGLHVTGTPIEVDFATYRLEITGLVDNPLSLAYDDLRCMPRISAAPDLVCPGFFVDVANWSGVPIKFLLEKAGIQPLAQQITLVSADGYSRSFSIEETLMEDNFLAYELEGKPIPVLHGFPLRVVFPNLDGSHWIKWLVEIRVE